jgi:Flp pilus assembly protein TadG
MMAMPGSFASLPGTLRRRLRAARGDTRGVAMVEMAFTLPTIMLIGLGGLEIANLTLANTQMSQIALSAADNAARIASGSNLASPQVREIDINEVFTGAQLQSGDLNLQANGRIILSSLEVNADGGQWIRWQRCYGNRPSSPSSYGTAGTGATGTAFAGMGPTGRKVTAVAGNGVMFVEIVYTYRPLFFTLWLGNQTIRSTAAFSVREARDYSQVYNPSPAATVSSC